jgi:hypothetical protein
MACISELLFRLEKETLLPFKKKKDDPRSCGCSVVGTLSFVGRRKKKKASNSGPKDENQAPCRDAQRDFMLHCV